MVGDNNKGVLAIAGRMGNDELVGHNDTIDAIDPIVYGVVFSIMMLIDISRYSCDFVGGGFTWDGWANVGAE